LYSTKISDHLGVIDGLKKMKMQFFNRVVDNGERRMKNEE
jgi:hypothetical protein